MHFTAVYMKVPEGYIPFVEELPGANTQGATLQEAKGNSKRPSPWFWKRTANSRKNQLPVRP